MKFQIRDFLFGIVGYVILKSEWLRNRFLDLGEVASFQTLIEQVFGERIYFRSRNSLRSRILLALNYGPCRVYEFGVAGGDTARWLKKKVDNPDFSYHGWDTFTGLPLDWVRNGIIYRNRGFFDNHGRIPMLHDARFIFHKGLIEEKLETLRESLRFDGQKVFFFDFDLYDPTLIVWHQLESYLKPDDLIYFDEAFDSSHERRLILEKIVPNLDSFEYVGNTTIALLIRKR